MIQVIHSPIIRFFVVISRWMSCYYYTVGYSRQEVMFSALPSLRKTEKRDCQWEVIQSIIACWNFTLLSGEAQNLYISIGNCCLVLEMLVLILLLSACLILCCSFKSKAISMQLQPIDNDENGFQSTLKKSS